MSEALVRMVLVGLVVSMGAALPAGAETWTQWRNALQPKAEAGPELTLAVDGVTDYVIVLPKEATSQEEKAAEDLQHWLQEMTGASFGIVEDGGNIPAKVISIGRTSALERGAPELGRLDLGNEGYAIAAAGAALYLVGGRTRGAVNAVYALLEEDLGCRWYAGSSSQIPKRATLTFRPAPRSFVPKLTIRDPFYKAAFDATWSLRNRTNAPSAPVAEEWGGHVDYALFVHTFNTLVPPGTYFEEHPEYFMLDGNGNRIQRQLCTTNADAIRIATESVLRVLKEKPHAEIISVSKNDGGGTCLCPQCKALDDAEGTNAGALLYMINRVAEAVEKAYPDAIISTLAYLETVKPPKTVRPRRNVAIRLCTDNCMWAHPFTPAREIQAFHDAMIGWGAIHDRIHIWDYCVNFSHYTAPMPNINAIADNIRFFVAHHATGVMEQGAYQSPGAERDLLRSWVFAKLLWDPSRNEDALVQDFIWGYFGQAAPPIAAYNAALVETGRAHADRLKAPEGGIRYRMDESFLSEDFIKQAVALYDEAEALAENDEIRTRVRRDRLPILYVQLCRGPEFVRGLFGEDDRYAKLLARFESIAREVGLTHIYEGAPDLDQKLEAWRKAALP